MNKRQALPAGGHLVGLLQGKIPKYDNAVLADGHDLLPKELQRADTRQGDLFGD